MYVGNARSLVPLFSPHYLLNLSLHLGSYLGRTCGNLAIPLFSIPCNILQEQFHLGYFEDLRLNDSIGQFSNAWIANTCPSSIVYGN